MIGEDGISNRRTYDVCQPVAAVFAAGSALSWLAAGARSVDWWKASDSDNARGRCKNPDYAMFDSTGVRQPPYAGFLLASKLAQPHAVLSAVKSGNCVFGPCPTLPSPPYPPNTLVGTYPPTSSTPVLPALERQRTMPDPCAGVGNNPWCHHHGHGD